uniref:Uncharacterized protein n=1 Tax=Daphnia galeata TaxID=27404 RepID=A0A8J2WGV5_9CRUS|nr:unnamed protein product [Daphnia galeata]
MRIAIFHSFILIVIYLIYSDAATPQILKSQSLIPFPRVGRSRSSFIANSAGSARSGAAGGNANIKNSNNWMMVGYNLNFWVGKRQNLIPFPRVGRSGYYQGFFPNDDDEGISTQQFALSDEDLQGPSSFVLSGGDILGALNNGRSNSEERTAVFIPRPRWMISTSQESEE